MSRVVGVSVLTLALVAACARPAPRPVQVVSRGEAVQTALAPDLLTVPFAHGDDSNRVLRRFLETASARGARYVAAIAIHIVLERKGAPVECVTYIGPRADVEERGRALARVGYTEQVEVLKPVKRAVIERERQCRTVQHKRRVERDSGGESDYDVARNGTRAAGGNASETVVTEQECEEVPHTRVVTTYEFQTEARWVPPDLARISQQYSEWSLVESEPVCAPLRPNHGRENRIEGRLYFPPRT